MLHRSPRCSQTLLGVAALAALLAGCAPGVLDRGPAEVEVQRAAARGLQEAGDWTAAAEAWQRAAEAARGSERDVPLLAAAENWLRAGQPDQARSALARVSADPGAELAARRTLLEARLLLREDRARDALTRLAGVPMGPADPFAADLLAVRADAAFATRQPVIGVTSLVRRETMLTDAAQRSGNQRRIWNRLQEAAAAGVPLDAPAGLDPVSAGWLALGRVSAAHADNPFRFRAGLSDWRERNPWHPAAPGIVASLLAEYQAMTEFPQSVALLLPLSGRQAAAAGAVRDGFIGAYIAQGNTAERPALRVYDTAALGTTAAWELAVRNGADFVVGPLLKEELAELGGAELPGATGLALNWADDHVVLPPNIFQFALAPEDEAAEVARRAVRDGHRRALALAHDSEQGRRMVQSFVTAFEAAGGEVLDSQLFDPREADFSVEITGLLLIAESRARHQRMQSVLGRTLEYEPRRRQDADFLFLAARPAEALLIRPQLRFHYASDLPVYATSSIFDAGRSRNTELDGVLFADMPWRVGAGDGAFMAQFRAFGPNALERSGRLFAFGADAYRLVPLLHNRSESLASGVPGQTGVLQVGPEGRIHRVLEWGRFEEGEVRHAPGQASEQASEPAPATRDAALPRP
jgi:uncharacterized protein